MSPKPLRVLTVFQPWAWLIVHGWKDRENRPRLCNVRGPVLIHAAKQRSPKVEAAKMAAAQGLIDRLEPAAAQALRAALPDVAALPHGGIVGIADFTGDDKADSAKTTASPWFTGPHAYDIGAAAPLDFEPCRGYQGFWFYRGTMHTNAPAKMLRANLGPEPCPTCQAYEKRTGFPPLPHFLLACTCHLRNMRAPT